MAKKEVNQAPAKAKKAQAAAKPFTGEPRLKSSTVRRLSPVSRRSSTTRTL